MLIGWSLEWSSGTAELFGYLLPVREAGNTEDAEYAAVAGSIETDINDEHKIHYIHIFLNVAFLLLCMGIFASCRT